MSKIPDEILQLKPFLEKYNLSIKVLIDEIKLAVLTQSPYWKGCIIGINNAEMDCILANSIDHSVDPGFTPLVYIRYASPHAGEGDIGYVSHWYKKNLS